EDGIRDRTVTGVQTCALPISDVEEVGRVEVVEPAPPQRGQAAELHGDLGGRDRQLGDVDGADAGLRENLGGLGAAQRLYVVFDKIGRASCRERVSVLRVVVVE